jgi:Holliday junction resolvasome RuvABC ATP-dependent DNA helicase subunit
MKCSPQVGKIEERQQMMGFANVVGQESAIQQLRDFALLYHSHGQQLGHILLTGPEGIGKRTLAEAFANEIKSDFLVLDAADIEAKGDLTAVLTNLHNGQTLILQNLHQLSTQIVRVLEPALNGPLEITIGHGRSVRRHKIELMPFTLVATVPKENDCLPILRRRFALAITLTAFSSSELKEIALQLAAFHHLEPDSGATELLLRFARTPLEIETLLTRICRVSQGRIVTSEMTRILTAMGMPLYAPAGHDSQALQCLSGVQFEELIARTLSGLGFRTELTKASGDGGIDIVAFLDSPIVGGRYLFQCKRFAPTISVGAPTIRDFYGAVKADLAAVKGVFITTSIFTEQAREFANTVGLELIDGDKLRALLREQDRSVSIAASGFK